MSAPLFRMDSVWKRFCRHPRRGLRYGLEDIAEEALGREPTDRLRPGEFWSLQDVSLEVEAGEVLGLIGHNGAGKSTLINLAAQVLRPTLGRMVFYTDRVIAIDAQGGLTGSQTGRENIVTKLSMHGVSPAAIREAMPEIIAYSGIHEFIDAPTGTYSQGMRLRLAFSIYTQLKPDLFLIDEAIGGGDIRFRGKFQRFLREYVDGGGAILLASHDLFLVQSLCRRCLLLEHGKVQEQGDAETVVKRYVESMEAQGEEAATDGRLRGKRARAVPASPEDAAVVIVSASLTHEDGGEPISGEAAVARVEVEAARSLPGVQIGLEVGGFGIFPLASAMSPAEAPYRLEPGRRELTARVERLPLMPGAYDLCAAVLDQHSGAPLAALGFDGKPARFSVDAPDDPTMNLLRHRKGFLYLPAEFEEA